MIHATAVPLLTDPVRLFLSTTALFLIIGGLAILFLIVGLFLLQSLVPLNEAPDPLPAGKGKRRLRPIQGAPAAASPGGPSAGGPNARLWRRRPEDLAPVPRIDIALDRLVAENLGEPRILQRLSNGFRLRLWACRECATPAAKAHDLEDPACVRGRARILDACRAVFGDSVRVREVGCRVDQKPICDFEVLT